MKRSGKFDFMKWCEENVDWMEEERRRTGKGELADPAGFRNRSYRTSDQYYEAAKKVGFEVEKPIFPAMARNWLIKMRK